MLVPLRSAFYIFVCLTLVSAGCSSSKTSGAGSTQATAQASDQSPDSDDSPALEASAQEALESFISTRNGGAVVRLRRDNESFAAATGDANNNGDKLTVDQQFYVGSISKTFIATTVLQLVDEGTIDLDEQLEAYLPDTKIGGSATIRQLLSHESGIESYTDVPTFFTDALKDRQKRFTQDEILSYVEESAEAPTDPGFAYSNTNYILLGQLLEEVEGADINTILAKKITQPLVTSQTFFATADTTSADIAAGWSLLGPLRGDPNAEYASVESSAWTAGALVSTTQDLATFAEALFDGRLLSPEQLDEMTTTGKGDNGLGIFIIDLSPTQQVFSHSGAIPGYSSTMAYNPDNGDYIIVITNNDFLIADELASTIAEQW